ncbi:MAG TPA: hypothetical protein VIU63_02460 [Nitrospira sp.]
MHKTMIVMAMIAVNFVLFGCAQNPPERTHTATPTMGERIKEDTVSGKVKDIGPSYVAIGEMGGDTRRIRVDSQTKMDSVAIGDQVKAFVTDDGYASTIQRVSP